MEDYRNFTTNLLARSVFVTLSRSRPFLGKSISFTLSAGIGALTAGPAHCERVLFGSTDDYNTAVMVRASFFFDIVQDHDLGCCYLKWIYHYRWPINKLSFN